jgi:hypothetical protein
MFADPPIWTARSIAQHRTVASLCIMITAAVAIRVGALAKACARSVPAQMARCRREYGNGELRGDTGTSSSASLWAGVIALADQQAGRHLGFVNPALYRIARSRAYHRAFHDVVTGDNSIVTAAGVFTGYNTGPGWDPVTGWGSPDAQYLVPLLAHTRYSKDTTPDNVSPPKPRTRGGYSKDAQNRA